MSLLHRRLHLVMWLILGAVLLIGVSIDFADRLSPPVANSRDAVDDGARS